MRTMTNRRAAGMVRMAHSRVCQNRNLNGSSGFFSKAAVSHCNNSAEGVLRGQERWEQA